MKKVVRLISCKSNELEDVRNDKGDLSNEKSPLVPHNYFISNFAEIYQEIKVIYHLMQDIGKDDDLKAIIDGEK